MRENISILLLVLISTAVICFIIIEAYDITRPYRQEEEQAQVSENESAAPVLTAKNTEQQTTPVPSEAPADPGEKKEEAAKEAETKAAEELPNKDDAEAVAKPAEGADAEAPKEPAADEEKPAGEAPKDKPADKS